MPPLNQPATLVTLTLAAVGEYVHTIGQKVFNIICSKASSCPLAPEDGTLKKLTFDLESLNTALYSIPHVLWFDVTTNVLIGINQLIKNAHCTTDALTITGDHRCKNFIEELVVRLIGPHVTHMNFADCEPFLRQVMAKNLDRMQHIKVLTLASVKSGDVVIEHLAFLTSLTSFTMKYNCTDEIIEILAHNCKKLQTLNVIGSLDVTDNSIVNILKLDNLQFLQVSCTKISQTGILCLLGDTEGNNECGRKGINPLKNLQALGCGPMQNKQLYAIAHSCFNLTYLSLNTVSCDFSILSQMKHLKEFKVSCGNFILDNMEGLLEIIGHQLKLLDLLIMQDVDLSVIATHCVNLKTLSLRSCSVIPLLSTRLLTDTNDTFHKLEHLTFYMSCDVKLLEFVLTRCIALRTLVIGQISEVDDNFISSCLSKNPLNQLELFKVYFAARISVQSVQLLLERCPNLSVVGGFGTLETVQTNELLQLMNRLKEKNFDIKVLS